MRVFPSGSWSYFAICGVSGSLPLRHQRHPRHQHPIYFYIHSLTYHQLVIVDYSEFFSSSVLSLVWTCTTQQRSWPKAGLAHHAWLRLLKLQSESGSTCKGSAVTESDEYRHHDCWLYIRQWCGGTQRTTVDQWPDRQLTRP